MKNKKLNVKDKGLAVSTAEGLVRIRALKKDIATARLDLSMSKLKDTSILRKKRKEVARLLTAEQQKKHEKNA